MHEIDSLNYVKLDLLGLNAVGLIDGACKLAGIDYLTPDKVNFSDENVINSIAEDTTLIFQFESGFASDSLKRTLSKETLENIKAQNDNISCHLLKNRIKKDVSGIYLMVERFSIADTI